MIDRCEIQLSDMREENLVLLSKPTEGLSVLATSDFFFGDENFEFVAKGDQWGWVFFDKAVAAERDKVIERARAIAKTFVKKEEKEESANEKGIEDSLVEQLEKDGYKIKRQVGVHYGRIDVFIEGDFPKIIEIKTDPGIHSASEALSQLFRYSFSYPTAALYFYCPVKISETVEKMLLKRGVQIWN